MPLSPTTRETPARDCVVPPHSLGLVLVLPDKGRRQSGGDALEQCVLCLSVRGTQREQQLLAQTTDGFTGMTVPAHFKQ